MVPVGAFGDPDLILRATEELRSLDPDHLQVTKIINKDSINLRCMILIFSTLKKIKDHQQNDLTSLSLIPGPLAVHLGGRGQRGPAAHPGRAREFAQLVPATESGRADSQEVEIISRSPLGQLLHVF